MIVVSDTSPVSALIQIGEAQLLQTLFAEVILPPAVERELRASHPSLPAFLQVRSVSNRERVNELAERLDVGEAEAIVLATELHADRLLIDEKAGRQAAQAEGLAVIGVLGVLLLARNRNLIPQVRDRLERLDAAGFYLDEAVKIAALRAAGEE